MLDKKEIKASVLLGLLTVVFVFIFWLSNSFIDINSKSGFIIILLFLVYSILTFWIGSYIKESTNKILKILIIIISLPVLVIFFILKFSHPFIAVILNLIYYLFFSLIIPIGAIFILKKLNFANISYEIGVFIVLTVGTIVSVSMNKYLMKLIYRYSHAIKKDSKSEDNIEIIKLVEYLFTPNNVRFTIYLLYFVYLVVFSIKYLENESLFKTALTDIAILQAFLVFLAYDSIRVNSKDIKALPSVILKAILKIQTHDNSKE